LNYDVVVVGASSAGLFAAESLANLGKQVVVFDRSAGITPGERTYIITPGLYEVMSEIPSGLIKQKIDTFRIQSGQNQAEIQLSSPDLIIDRAELISYFASRASNAGASIQTDSVFMGLEVQEDQTKIKISKSDSVQLVSADYLIGADGVNSTVRKSIGLAAVPSVPLLQAVIDLPDSWDPSVVQVWFEIEQTPYFYWLIPKGNNQAVVGLISEQGAKIDSIIDDFLVRHNFKPLSFQSGQAALHVGSSPANSMVGNLPVFLVGDAAGHVKVTTVGGTVTGFIGAQNAVRMIQGTNDRNPYPNVNRELDLHHLIRKLLNQMAPGDYDDMIGLVNPAVADFLSLHDRDNMRSHFWKLAILQPRFIPLGLRLLFKSFFS
jgi:flavin-dependent dehydrogenase